VPVCLAALFVAAIQSQVTMPFSFAAQKFSGTVGIKSLVTLPLGKLHVRSDTTYHLHCTVESLPDSYELALSRKSSILPLTEDFGRISRAVTFYEHLLATSARGLNSGIWNESVLPCFRSSNKDQFTALPISYGFRHSLER